MRKLLFLAVASLAVVSVTMPAYAVKRGCHAQIYLKKGTLILPLDNYTARGWAVSNPNKARKMAARLARNCATAARDLRWERRKPSVCKPTSVYDYDIDSIKDKIESTACSYNRTKGTFEVRVKTWGDKGCKGDVRFMNYDITSSMC